MPVYLSVAATLSQSLPTYAALHQRGKRKEELLVRMYLLSAPKFVAAVFTY